MYALPVTRCTLHKGNSGGGGGGVGLVEKRVYVVTIDDVVVRLENDQASFYCVFCFKLVPNLCVFFFL